MISTSAWGTRHLSSLPGLLACARPFPRSFRVIRVLSDSFPPFLSGRLPVNNPMVHYLLARRESVLAVDAFYQQLGGRGS